MARRKIQNRNIRKISRIGASSLGITLPIEMLRELGWRERQKVKVARIRGGIQIRDWRSK